MTTEGTSAALAANERLVTKIVGRYILPGIMAQLGVKIGNVINTVIIGQLLGTDGLAIMSLIAPLELVMMSVGSLICVAGAVHAGYAVARGENADDWYSAAFWAVIIAGLVISAAGMVFADSLAMLLGADAKQHATLISAIRAMLCGGVFMPAVYLPMNFLKVVGRPGAAMNILFVMSGVNIAAAVFFAVVLGLGVPGAMLGTACSYAAAFIYGQVAFHRADSGMKLRFIGRYFKGKAKGLALGVSSALNNILRAFLALCVNLMIIWFLGDHAGQMMSAVAVLNSIMNIMNAFVFGISQSALQIAGIAYSEKDFKTVTAAIKNIFIIGNIIVGVLAIALVGLRYNVGYIFGVGDKSFAPTVCVFVACYANLYLCNNIMTNFFSAVRRNLVSIVIVSMRLTVFMLVPALILLLFGAGNISILIGYFCAEFIAFASLLIYTARKHKRNPNLSRFLLLNNSELKYIRSLDFSVKCTEEEAASASEKVSAFLEEADLPMKDILRISMAVEEIVVLVCAHADNRQRKFGFGAKKKTDEYIDIRIFRNIQNAQSGFSMRVRYGGKDFNPIKYCQKHADDDSDALGMNIVLKLAKNVHYSRTLGVNNVLLEI
jgi:Na+-driven multidrug efflux pump/anti-sigma regulatory factor (Ser/Thr protein kinase)